MLLKLSWLCLSLIILLSHPALADTIHQKYVDGEVLVVIDAPEPSEYEEMGVFNANIYSHAISNQAVDFAGSRGLEARNTYPEIARYSGKSIIHLRSEHKSTSQLMRELSSLPNVESIMPNYRIKLDQIPNDPYYLPRANPPFPTNWPPSSWPPYFIPNPPYSGLWGMEHINMPQVWNHFRVMIQ